MYQLGWEKHLFWSQTPPIYPNILHNIVTLVAKHQILDRKINTTPPKKLMYRKWSVVGSYAEGLEAVAELPLPSRTVASLVGQCKLDPSLKATCFKPLNLRVHTVLST